jgi:RecG-like helicase
LEKKERRMHIAEIPSRQAAILEKKGVTTYRQLMTMYPKRYYDMRSPRRTLSQRDIKEKHAFVGVMGKAEKSEFQGQTYVKA